MPEKHYLPREIEEEIEEHKRSPRSREGAPDFRITAPKDF